MTASYDFSGHAVVVTGAGTGIGRAAALRFGAAGAAVAIVDIDDESAAEVVSAIDAAGGTAIAAPCDVTSAEAVAGAFEAIASFAGGVDVLVNNAGGFWHQLTTEETSEEEWDRVVDLNLKGVFLCSRAAIPWLRQSGRGRIINIGSLAGQTTIYRSSPPYAAAKAGVHALTRVMAYELAAERITVNAIAPSAIATDRVSAVRSDEERARTAASLPVGHYGEPEDVVALMMWLAAEESAYTTGQTIAVNGGRFMV